MKVQVTLTIVATVLALAASVHLLAQSRAAGAPTSDRGWTGARHGVGNRGLDLSG